MAATSHPAASQTAIDILKRGGNAMDAAVAAVAVQCVVEPMQTGIGGDCFALWTDKDGKIRGLNASGPAPAATDASVIRAQIGPVIPSTSAHAVSIPGAIGGWQALTETAGSMALGDLLQPAIAYARDGFRLTPRIAWDWSHGEARLRNSEAGIAYYLPQGGVPLAGDKIALPKLASTLEAIARDGAATFYEGAIAENMAAFLKAVGGGHTAEDFARYRPEFVEPISTDYKGVRVFECPPNGQGIIAILMINMLRAAGHDREGPESVGQYHFLAEATKLAFRERDRWLADPHHAGETMHRLASNDLASNLARLIDPERASDPLPPSPLPKHEDTVYLTVVDRDRNVVSLINSLFETFGSGLCCPETGVLFHCRGRAFSLEEGHDNMIAPGKRPAHTIIPGLMTKDDKPLAGFGVMGGDFQPIGHTQVTSNLVDYGLGPQAAIDCPRVMAYPGPLEVETRVPIAVRSELEALGHEVVEADKPHGGGQMILIDHDRGILVGGSDPRKDGIALGY